MNKRVLTTKAAGRAGAEQQASKQGKCKYSWYLAFDRYQPHKDVINSQVVIK
jgi:hypothetical protein